MDRRLDRFNPDLEELSEGDKLDYGGVELVYRDSVTRDGFFYERGDNSFKVFNRRGGVSRKLLVLSGHGDELSFAEYLHTLEYLSELPVEFEKGENGLDEVVYEDEDFEQDVEDIWEEVVSEAES